MNKDIQALIEREAEEQGHRLFVFDVPDITTFCQKLKSNSFKEGAKIALSLFKWRKVSEELPEDNKKVLIRHNLNDLFIACLCRDEDDLYFSSDCGSEFLLREIREWMPIPLQ